MVLPSLNETIEVVKASIEAADPALTREEFVQLGLSEKASANRKTLLKYLREKVKEFPEVEATEDVIDAPGEPPPGYVSTPEVEMTEAPVESKPLMQKIDPRKCEFPFRALDINRYPVCVIHNSGMCAPCSHEHEESGEMRCRVVCFAESDKHHNIKQPTVIMKDHAIVDNPATVEMVSVSEFDE
ncbi:MAG: hypothetical protein E3J60_04695 [Dehalococcoidia bacterium]|nr:MAG: hypothetical protein E3J60_04695 [Dehalococcoidia bacterium]